MRKIWLALTLWTCGCFSPSWKSLTRGEAPLPAESVLVGSVSLVPGPRQRLSGRAVAPLPLEGQMVAVFTRDRSEAPNPYAPTLFSRCETATIPISGPFAVKVPSDGRWYLRAFLVPTDMGREIIEAPFVVLTPPKGQVAYVGELQILRVPPREYRVNDRWPRVKADPAFVALQDLRWYRALAHTGDVAVGGRRDEADDE